MMERIFNMDNGFWRAMSLIADMFYLNLLWFICSIPIFTIGASTTALYYVMLKLVEGKEGNMTRQFFRSFKQNFKQGVVIGLIEMILIVVAVVDIIFYINVHSTVGMIFRIIMVVFALYMSMSATYVFAILAKFENTTKRILGFSLVLPIRHLWATLIMLLSEAVLIAVFFFIYPPVALLGMGLVAFINSKFFVGIFDQYIPEEKKIDPVDMPLPELPEDFVTRGKHIVIDAEHPEHVVLTEDDVKQDSGNEQ